MDLKVRKNRTIKETAKANLCTGCGTCVALCPFSAIEMVKDDSGKYTPKLDEKKCTLCGICNQVCPGYSVDFKELNQDIFGKEPDDISMGNYLNCYTGCATDYNVRYSSSSGGLVTALLIYALEQGIIDGALVTRMKRDKPLEPEPFIARTRGEVVEASNSKYCPVAANTALKEILEQEGKYAVVGLPCHLHGIRKAEMINKNLKERIVLHIGIFCLKTISFTGTEDLLHRRGIRKEDVEELRYRGNGYPGQMLIKFKDGCVSFLETGKYYDLRFAQFTLQRCILCCDHTSELSAVSFGDAWLPEIVKEDKIGTSIIISRTKWGEGLLQQMVCNGLISLTPVDANKIYESQGGFAYKREQLKARLAISKFLLQKIPDCDYSRLPRCSKKDYFYGLIIYLNCILASKRRYWWLFEIYSLLISFGSRLKSR